MTKEKQEDYIKENIGYILSEYREKKVGKNRLALLFDEGLMIVSLPDFLKGAEPKQRSKYKRYFKDLIRKKIVPVVSKDDNTDKLVIYNLQREA